MIELAEWIVSAVIVCLAVYFVGGYVFMIVGQPIYDIHKKGLKVDVGVALMIVMGVVLFTIALVGAYHLWMGLLSGHLVSY